MILASRGDSNTQMAGLESASLTIRDRDLNLVGSAGFEPALDAF